ncbi:MAG: YdcF family protein [Rhodobacterales bacterium]|nr:YdcF family protein [Rhodobacterales bacterium]
MNTAFFVASKLIWALVRPESWIVLGLALSLLAAVRGRVAAARRWGGLTLAFVLAVAVLPLGDLAIRPLETRYPADPPLTQVAGIIVLGGGEDAQRTAYWGPPQFGEGAERFTAALELARAWPQARVLFTGGSGSLRDLGSGAMSGATVAEAFFLAQGLAPERLLFERASRNTAENAALSLALVQPGEDETWVLVTSAFHMPRSLASFEAAGWTGLVPYPVDYRSGGFGDGIGWDLARNLLTLNTAVREYIGLVAYRVTGR